MSEHMIVGVHVTNRLKKASEVQKILTRYGCNIKTRIGLHDVAGRYCRNCGLLILELVGDKKERHALVQELSRIPGLEVKKMVFTPSKT